MPKICLEFSGCMYIIPSFQMCVHDKVHLMNGKIKQLLSRYSA